MKLIVCSLLFFGFIIGISIIAIRRIKSHDKKHKKWLEHKEEMLNVPYTYRGKQYMLPIRRDEKALVWDRLNRQQKEKYVKPFMKAVKKGQIIIREENGYRHFIPINKAKEKGWA